jgi:hypothetical protein
LHLDKKPFLRHDKKAIFLYVIIHIDRKQAKIMNESLIHERIFHTLLVKNTGTPQNVNGRHDWIGRYGRAHGS